MRSEEHDVDREMQLTMSKISHTRGVTDEVWVETATCRDMSGQMLATDWTLSSTLTCPSWGGKKAALIRRSIVRTGMANEGQERRVALHVVAGLLSCEASAA